MLNKTDQIQVTGSALCGSRRGFFDRSTETGKSSSVAWMRTVIRSFTGSSAKNLRK